MLSLLNLLRACPLEVIQLFYQQTFLLRADGGTAGVAGLSDIALTKSDRQVWLGTDLLIKRLRPLETHWWPVLKLHAQGQAASRQDFFDFVERLAAKVWCLEQFVFGALN